MFVSQKQFLVKFYFILSYQKIKVEESGLKSERLILMSEFTTLFGNCSMLSTLTILLLASTVKCVT